MTEGKAKPLSDGMSDQRLKEIERILNDGTVVPKSIAFALIAEVRRLRGMQPSRKIATLEEEVQRLQDERIGLCADLAAKGDEVTDLREKNAALRAENVSLREHNARMVAGFKETEKLHPSYGPCDGFRNGACSECFNIYDGLLIEQKRLVLALDQQKEMAENRYQNMHQLKQETTKLRALLKEALQAMTFGTNPREKVIELTHRMRAALGEHKGDGE